MRYFSLLQCVLIFCLLLFLSNCIQPKKVIYFQNAVSSSEVNKNYSPSIKPDDLLSIYVSSSDADASKPFNPFLNMIGASTIGGYTQGAASPLGYLVDADGNIEFPKIGKLKVGGLTRNEIVELISSKLNTYLKEPSVQIRILNYKITVLGDVKNPGTFTIPNERVTLLEAIGIAGDLNITAKRKNISVIRDRNGKRTTTLVDLTSSDLFNSPVYFLEQNDLVYVQPNKTKINSAAVNPSNVSIVVSIVTAFITLAILLNR